MPSSERRYGQIRSSQSSDCGAESAGSGSAAPASPGSDLGCDSTKGSAVHAGGGGIGGGAPSSGPGRRSAGRGRERERLRGGWRRGCRHRRARWHRVWRVPRHLSAFRAGGCRRRATAHGSGRLARRTREGDRHPARARTSHRRDRSWEVGGRPTSASAHGQGPAARPDDTVSPIAGRTAPPGDGSPEPSRGLPTSGTTQKTPATAYFPEGLPPEYLRRWRA